MIKNVIIFFRKLNKWDLLLVMPLKETTYNGKDRNAFEFGLTPQSELWNDRLAMIGCLAYQLGNFSDYSVL